MLADENKELVRRFYNELWNKRNLDIYDEIAPNLGTDHKDWAHGLHTTLSNHQVTILDALADGNQVAVHWRASAVHQGFLGIPATGKPITFQGISILRVENGKIVDDFGYWDSLAILRQLGATSIPDQDSHQ